MLSSFFIEFDNNFICIKYVKHQAKTYINIYSSCKDERRNILVLFGGET